MSARWRGLTPGSPGLAAEIRLRVGKLAGTPEDRLRLRIEVDAEAEQVQRTERMTADRRERLLSIVEG